MPQGATVEIKALGAAIEHSLKIASEVQSSFHDGLHQITETSLHATRRCERQKQELTDLTKLSEESVNTMLRFESAESRTHEGKF